MFLLPNKINFALVALFALSSTTVLKAQNVSEQCESETEALIESNATTFDAPDLGTINATCDGELFTDSFVTCTKDFSDADKEQACTDAGGQYLEFGIAVTCESIQKDVGGFLLNFVDFPLCVGASCDAAAFQAFFESDLVDPSDFEASGVNTCTSGPIDNSASPPTSTPPTSSGAIKSVSSLLGGLVILGGKFFF